MKISNLFESTEVVDYGVEAMRYSNNDISIINTHFKDDKNVTSNIHVNGWIYYFLILSAVLNPAKQYSRKINLPPQVVNINIDGKLYNCRPESMAFYEPLSAFIRTLHDDILLNQLSESPKSAEELYNYMLDNPVRNGDTLIDIANDLRDYAVQLADDLADKGFTDAQLWGKYSVAKFERVFLEFVLKRI